MKTQRKQSQRSSLDFLQLPRLPELRSSYTISCTLFCVLILVSHLQVSEKFAFGLFDLDWDVFMQHIEGAINRVPVLEKTGIKSTVCGPGNAAAGRLRSSKDLHRITECFGLEGTFRGHLAQPPCSEQGHLQPDQVAQSPVQPDLECSQG